MEERQFVISGKTRKAKKKELSLLKYSVKMFWYWEDVDRVYGGGFDNDEQCYKHLEKQKKKIERLEKELSERI